MNSRDSCLGFLEAEWTSLFCRSVDPNKERREAVKRKTTQYLKRAEEIFNSHLQNNFGRDTTQLGV